MPTKALSPVAAFINLGHAPEPFGTVFGAYLTDNDRPKLRRDVLKFLSLLLTHVQPGCDIRDVQLIRCLPHELYHSDIAGCVLTSGLCAILLYIMPDAVPVVEYAFAEETPLDADEVLAVALIEHREMGDTTDDIIIQQAATLGESRMTACILVRRRLEFWEDHEKTKFERWQLATADAVDRFQKLSKVPYDPLMRAAQSAFVDELGVAFEYVRSRTNLNVPVGSTEEMDATLQKLYQEATGGGRCPVLAASPTLLPYLLATGDLRFYATTQSPRRRELAQVYRNWLASHGKGSNPEYLRQKLAGR